MESDIKEYKQDIQHAYLKQQEFINNLESLELEDHEVKRLKM